MSRFALLEQAYSSGLDIPGPESQSHDKWLSLAPRLLPDISDAHARRILGRERPSTIRLPKDESGIF